jgi:thiol-disulfide isomerase/thioredoxin
LEFLQSILKSNPNKPKFYQPEDSFQHLKAAKELEFTQIYYPGGIGKQTGVKHAPFVMQDLDSQWVSTQSFKGKYLLIDFWASWCGPCRRENPNLVRAYEEFNSKGFELLGVSLDENPESLVQAIENDKLQWAQISELKGWTSLPGWLYNVYSIPSNMLIDPNGTVIDVDLRGDRLRDILEENIKK